MKRVDIKCRGRKIYSDVPLEEATEILQDLAEAYYNGSDVDPSEIELEPID